jgi:6-phosphofructokinase 1
MFKKRIGILTGGGDVPPLNAIIASAVESCKQANIELIGFMKGWQGLIENLYVNLSDFKVNPAIGGTILKSSRIKLDGSDERLRRAQENLQRIGIEGIIVIGGEDTLSNSLSLPDFPQVLISKTIDNDVGMMPKDGRGIDGKAIVNYFTLGFPTAARKISSFVSLTEGLRSTAYSHERIIVVESMGMHAGWLALSSCMGHPDFIIIPEFPLDYERFKSRVMETYGRQRQAIIVVAEGARFSDGCHISADECEKDEFGHPRFKGAAEVLAKKLKQDLKKKFDTRNVNAVNPSYLYRSGSPCKLDMRWAFGLGREAVKILVDGREAPTFLGIKRTGRGFGVMRYPLAKISTIEEFHRFVDWRFYSADLYCATAEAKKYLGAVAQDIPMIEYGVDSMPDAGRIEETR